MIATEINEPILISSKPNRISFYFNLLWPILIALVGFHMFLSEGDILLFLLGTVMAGLNWFGKYSDEIHITHKAIYERLGLRKYNALHFTDLTYAHFEDPEAIFLMFGMDGSEGHTLTNDANNYEKIKTHLEEFSKEHLPHHRYEFTERSELKVTDKLGCLNCKRVFGFSAVKQWVKETTGWLFKRQKDQSPICPYCRSEDSVIVSRSGRITFEGLTSMSALRSNQ